MKEAKKEPGRIRAYRLVLRGATNGEMTNRKHRLACVYRTRVSELRLMMQDKFGDHPGGDWIPGVQIEPKEENVFFWKIIVPPGADPRDPLGLLNLQAEKKTLDTDNDVHSNQQTVMPFKTGGDHGQDDDEGHEGAHQEGTGDGTRAA